MAENYINRVTGAVKDKKDSRDYIVNGISAAKALPKSYTFLYEKAKQIPASNQADYPTCGGHAGAHKADFDLIKKTSSRFMYSACKAIDGYPGRGTYSRTPAQALCEIGIVEEADYPERHDISYQEYKDWNRIPQCLKDKAADNKNESYWRIIPSFGDLHEAIKQTVFTYETPVFLTYPWFKNYNINRGDGVLPPPQGTSDEGHFGVVVGWDEHNRLIMKNSFGEHFGRKGYLFVTPICPKWDAWICLDIPKHAAVDDRYGRTRNTLLEFCFRFANIPKMFSWTPFLKAQVASALYVHRKMLALGRNPGSITEREYKAVIYGGWDYESVFLGINGDVWLNFKKSDWLIK